MLLDFDKSLNFTRPSLKPTNRENNSASPPKKKKHYLPGYF